MKGFVPNSCLEPLYRSVQSASLTAVPSCSSNNVPSQAESKNSDRRRSKAGGHCPTSRQLEPPPPSYDEVVSSADSSPHSGRSRTAAPSEDECYITTESGKDSHIYEEIPESNVSAILFAYFNIINLTTTAATVILPPPLPLLSTTTITTTTTTMTDCHCHDYYHNTTTTTTVTTRYMIGQGYYMLNAS